MLNKEEAIDSIDSYLGDSEKSVLRTLTANTLKLFMKQRIQLNTSYYVRGNEETLKQFKAYYLACCLKQKERLKYGMQMISEHASLLASDSAEDIGVEDILFLYVHKNESGIGKTEEWIIATTLNEVSNRNRKGYTTIILSERPIDQFKDSDELKYINLGVKDKSKKVIIKEIKEGTNSNSAVSEDGTNYGR